MENCALIAMGAFDSVPFPPGIDSVSTRVYRREQIASLLHIPVTLFADWCILRGNDFTVDLLEREGLLVPDEVQSHDQYADMSAFIASRTVSEELSMAIEFSRAFYALDDLSGFYSLDLYRTSHFKDCRQCDIDEGIILSIDDELDVGHWVVQNIEQLGDKDNTELVLSYFDHLRNNRNTGILQSCHFEALNAMLNDKSILSTDEGPVLMYWDNVCASNYCQLLIKTLFRQLQKTTESKSFLFQASFSMLAITMYSWNFTF
jgi:hypothetical protein